MFVLKLGELIFFLFLKAFYRWLQRTEVTKRNPLDLFQNSRAAKNCPKGRENVGLIERSLSSLPEFRLCEAFKFLEHSDHMFAVKPTGSTKLVEDEGFREAFL